MAISPAFCPNPRVGGVVCLRCYESYIRGDEKLVSAKTPQKLWKARPRFYLQSKDRLTLLGGCLLLKAGLLLLLELTPQGLRRCALGESCRHGGEGLHPSTPPTPAATRTMSGLACCGGLHPKLLDNNRPLDTHLQYATPKSGEWKEG